MLRDKISLDKELEETKGEASICQYFLFPGPNDTVLLPSPEPRALETSGPKNPDELLTTVQVSSRWRW